MAKEIHSETFRDEGVFFVVLVGVAAFAVSAAMSLLAGMPKPEIHDEFSYLLAADTFAHGRLSNPTHPMWIHFETLHVNQQPSYASMYPPGQGLLLALGKIATGYPIVGAWLGVALGCAAVCWMLMAWLPPRWALLGGMLVTLHPMVMQWSQNYWGGGLAMAGGALVLGGFRRVLSQPRSRDAAVLGIGVGILANSRPYEGLILSMLVLATLLVWTFRRSSPGWQVMLRQFFVPAFLTLLPAGIFIGYYNYRVTGNVLRLPVMVNFATYGQAPPFLWMEARPQAGYRHAAIEKFHGELAMKEFRKQRTLIGFVSRAWEKILGLAKDYFQSWGLIAPLLMILFKRKIDPWMRLELALFGSFLLAFLPVTWMQTHYTAPIVPLGFVIVAQGMRDLYQWHWRNLSLGTWAVNISLLVCVIAAVLAFRDLSYGDPHHLGWYSKREQIISHLNKKGGKHLVVVRYGPEHDPHLEWVYNGADIDGSQVVWAREMNDAQNLQLVNYFKDRKVWLFDADTFALYAVR
jgi:hypothetical protein